MPKERILVILALSFVIALGFAGAPGAGPGPDAPYTGVIQNHTGHCISVPSANSGGTLIVPPGGWIEYVAWAPEFQLIGYVAGQPYYCRKITVVPKNYAFKCKSYDFLAEITAVGAVDKPKPVRKKPAAMPECGGEVEGLG
jgi:hypothetical protein